MAVQRKWYSLAGRDAFNVLFGFGAGPDAAHACNAGFARALREIETCGFRHSQIVRSRIWARDAQLRRTASDARLQALAGERRAASASFIAPERLPDGVDVIVDIEAIDCSGPKRIVEYEPKIAPPIYIALENVVCLSGNTDESATFDAQVDHICQKIAAALSKAGCASRDMVRVDAYVSTKADMATARRMIGERFSVAATITTVAGFSAPEKLIEIEATAALAK